MGRRPGVAHGEALAPSVPGSNGQQVALGIVRKRNRPTVQGHAGDGEVLAVEFDRPPKVRGDQGHISPKRAHGVVDVQVEDVLERLHEGPTGRVVLNLMPVHARPDGGAVEPGPGSAQPVVRMGPLVAQGASR